jgi:hypothetical protein
VEAPPGYWVHLHNRSGLISSKYYKMIAQAHHSQPLIDHILSKTGWTLSTFRIMDWDSHHRAFRRLTHFQRISTTKLVIICSIQIDRIISYIAHQIVVRVVTPRRKPLSMSIDALSDQLLLTVRTLLCSWKGA